MKIEDARVGMEVVFGRVHGEKTRGVIIRINQRTLSVRTLEERGTYRRRKAGYRHWLVVPALCERA